MSDSLLFQAFIYLSAAVIAVPIAKRLGLGSVLGYLIAGVLIGPGVFGFVGDQTAVMHFAEFGVVMMLFLIGLELRPQLLWQLRTAIIGLGGSQVLITTAIITGCVYAAFSLPWQTALAIGLAFALSSTAIVLQSLDEKGLTRTEAGQNAFSVLLFQDIAVIPILALFPLLSLSSESELHASTAHSLLDGLPAILQFLLVVSAIATVIIAGRFLIGGVFSRVAATRLRELFTALTLLIIIAIALLMEVVGLSPALGTFIAGVVLAESEFRHEIEVDLEPFKGLLLGLFFITVGASMDFNVIQNQAGLISLLVALLLIIKIAVLAVLANVFKINKGQKLLFTFALAQGGEFAFVLTAFGLSSGVFNDYQSSIITAVVTLSMLSTPILLVFYELLRQGSGTGEMTEETPDKADQVIIAGYGRFGQIVGRLLISQGYQPTILENSPSQIELLRKFGNKVFYGDPSRKHLLEAAGADNAKLLIIAIDDAAKSLDIIHTAQKHFPHLRIIVRAIDRQHSYQLIDLGIEQFEREYFHSAIALAKSALVNLGESHEQAQRIGDIFAKHDGESLNVLAKLWGDDKSYGLAVKQRTESLRQVLESDQKNQQEAQ
jgi:glutathione-regulated potassium-efflux system ancillary protein KefC/glutathione-regulated potassium-efflux system protein KefB